MASPGPLVWAGRELVRRGCNVVCRSAEMAGGPLRGPDCTWSSCLLLSSVLYNMPWSLFVDRQCNTTNGIYWYTSGPSAPIEEHSTPSTRSPLAMHNNAPLKTQPIRRSPCNVAHAQCYNTSSPRLHSYLISNNNAAILPHWPIPPDPRPTTTRQPPVIATLSNFLKHLPPPRFLLRAGLRRGRRRERARRLAWR